MAITFFPRLGLSKPLSHLVFVVSLLMASGQLQSAEDTQPRVLPEGRQPNDLRLQEMKDLNGYFPFKPCRTPEEWEARASRVRGGLDVALGLWPMPPKTRLNPVVHGKIVRDDYTIEKVYFASVPGFFVTGNLYRPKGKHGKLPAILSPHGHWKNGRFVETPAADLEKDINSGAERFMEGGRSPLQSRCVQLARMGCVVFHYDMIGYADCTQITEDIAHRFSKQRPEMNSTNAWGLFSPQAESHLQSVMGLQAWNSIRALDFLLSLPDVDSKRIGVTGASGGGTQTFLLCALDPRPEAAFPAVMVSTAMQGGCTCENASLLRVDTGNVEIAALFAPKPLGMTAANDWTKEMPTKGFPELRTHYAMMGSPSNVALTPLLQFGHNYNYPSRAAMYSWFNRHLKLGVAEPVVERDYKLSTPKELTVWDNMHPKPAGGPDLERRLLSWITDRDQKLLAGARNSLKKFRSIYGGAMDAMIGRTLAEAGSVSFGQMRQTDRGDYIEKAGLLRNVSYGEELPILVLEPKASRGETVMWVSPDGKAGMFTAVGDVRPRPGVLRLLEVGATVIGVDLLFQGEFNTNGQPVARARRVANPREAAAYTYGYNYSLFAQRVQDLLSVIRYARDELPGPLHMVGVSGAGHWVAAAKAQAGAAVDRVAIDTGGFRFINLTDIYDADFLPGAAKYGDLPGMLALAAPGKLWLAGERDGVPDLVKRVYWKAGGKRNLKASDEDSTDSTHEAVKWLLEEMQARNNQSFSKATPGRS